MILHLAILLAFQLAGETLVRLVGAPVPGPVAGLVLLLGAMLAFPRLAQAIRATATGLLSHLSLLFVPAGVGVVGHVGALGGQTVAILLALALSTALALAVGAWVFSRLAGQPGSAE